MKPLKFLVVYSILLSFAEFTYEMEKRKTKKKKISVLFKKAKNEKDKDNNPFDLFILGTKDDSKDELNLLYMIGYSYKISEKVLDATRKFKIISFIWTIFNNILLKNIDATLITIRQDREKMEKSKDSGVTNIKNTEIPENISMDALKVSELKKRWEINDDNANHTPTKPNNILQKYREILFKN